MNKLVELLEKQKGFERGKGATDIQIKNAEEALYLKFSEEYRSYLREFGNASYYGHILTGIAAFPAIDVVSVTESNRAYNNNIPSDFYVIEELHIDGVVIWQASDGAIYQTLPNASPFKICDSFFQYIQVSKV